MLVNSTNFLLSIDGTILGHSKDATINISHSLLDTTTKDSQGWRDYLSSIRSSTIKVSGFSDYGGDLSYHDLVSMVLTKQRLEIIYKDWVEDKYVFNGKGYITSVSESAEAENTVSYSLEITMTTPFGLSNQRVWNTIFTKWNELSDLWQTIN